MQSLTNLTRRMLKSQRWLRWDGPQKILNGFVCLFVCLLIYIFVCLFIAAAVVVAVVVFRTLDYSLNVYLLFLIGIGG